MTARTVVLTGAQNVADRLRATQTQFTDLAISTRSELEGKASQANTLLKNIAALNQQITRSQSSGQPSNDLLDRRQQYVLDLNEYIQTTQVMQDNGSLTVFMANQAVVQGSKAGAISVVADAQDPSFSRLQLQNGSAVLKLDDQIIAGGQLKGLLEFEQKDLSLAKNLIGRLAMTVGLAVNQQHMAGWDFEGNSGKAMFSVPAQVLGIHEGGGQGNVQFTDSTKFMASSYVVQMDSAGTGRQVIRQIDGKTTNFPIDLSFAMNSINVDGLTFTITSSSLGAGQSMLFKPFADAAGNIQALLTSPLSVAAASALGNGSPTQMPSNSGNAKALMDLRDAKLIDGGRLTEAYATSVSQIGLRVQSVQFSLEASQSIASSMSVQKAKASSVNLDEEAARLMQFQQAYQASAKILQVAQRVMDTMLQDLGR
jgi:flagellar hook-associated protein 1 FlgK